MELDFFRDKRVFVTGHTGFKGSWLCKILLMAGARVTGYALPPSNEYSLFARLNLASELTDIAGDVRNGDQLSAAMLSCQPEIVLHLAAQPIVREGYHNPVYTYETNVMGTVNLLEAIRRCNSVRSVVNVTTDKVYRNTGQQLGYCETDTLNGADPYSNSKSCSELVTASYKYSFFDHLSAIAVSTARAGNVIGGGDFAPDRIIPDCIRALEKGQSIIVRNPQSIRPYQHVLDCLYGYLLLAYRQYDDTQYAGSYNFGPNDAGCLTTAHLVDLFCASWGEKAKWVQQDAGGPHEASLLKLDCSRAMRMLGWCPSYSLETTIEHLVRWTKATDKRQITEEQIAEFIIIKKQEMTTK